MKRRRGALACCLRASDRIDAERLPAKLVRHHDGYATCRKTTHGERCAPQSCYVRILTHTPRIAGFIFWLPSRGG